MGLFSFAPFLIIYFNLIITFSLQFLGQCPKLPKFLQNSLSCFIVVWALNVLITIAFSINNHKTKTWCKDQSLQQSWNRSKTGLVWIKIGTCSKVSLAQSNTVFKLVSILPFFYHRKQFFAHHLSEVYWSKKHKEQDVRGNFYSDVLFSQNYLL